jgi:hypothetical protein
MGKRMRFTQDLVQDSEGFGERLAIEKLEPADERQVTEVFHFINTLAHQQDTQLTQAAAKTSEPSFAAVPDNDEDAAYDRL